MKKILGLAACAVWLVSPTARADVTVGAVLSLTGPAAALGIPERNAIELMPKTFAGQAVRYVVMDDASDSTAAVRAARKLIEEEKVDLIIGASNTPNSLAIIDTAASAGTPVLVMAGCDECILPPTGPRRWIFKMAPSAKMMMDMVADHLAARGGKTIGVIAFSTAFGDTFGSQLEASAKAKGITPLLNVKYNPGDTSVTPQVLRVLSAKPDAVFIAASATPGALPVIELRNRGFTGPIYVNQGMASGDVLRVGGKALEGVVFPVSPALVAEELPDSSQVKPAAVAEVRAYEQRFGPGSRNLPAASMWDAIVLADKATGVALKSGQPGTPDFRAALRDAIEATTDLVGSQGVYNMSPTDHSGLDQRGLVMVTVKDGTWSLVR